MSRDVFVHFIFLFVAGRDLKLEVTSCRLSGWALPRHLVCNHVTSPCTLVEIFTIVTTAIIVLKQLELEGFHGSFAVGVVDNHGDFRNLTWVVLVTLIADRGASR